MPDAALNLKGKLKKGGSNINSPRIGVNFAALRRLKLFLKGDFTNDIPTSLKRGTKLLALLMTLVMLVGSLPISAFAADTDVDSVSSSVIELDNNEMQESTAEDEQQALPQYETEGNQDTPVLFSNENSENGSDNTYQVPTMSKNGLKAFNLSATPINEPAVSKVSDGFKVNHPAAGIMQWPLEYNYLITMPQGTTSVTISLTSTDENGFFIEDEPTEAVSLVKIGNGFSEKPENAVSEITVDLENGKGSSGLIFPYTTQSNVYSYLNNAIYRFVVTTAEAKIGFNEDLPAETIYTLGDTEATPLHVEVKAPENSSISYAWYKGSLLRDISQLIPEATESSYTPDISAVGATYYQVKATITQESGSSTEIVSQVAKVVVKNPDVVFSLQKYGRLLNLDFTVDEKNPLIYHVQANTSYGSQARVTGFVGAIKGTIPDGLTIKEVWTGERFEIYNLQRSGALDINYDLNTFEIDFGKALEKELATNHNYTDNGCIYIKTSDDKIYTIIVDSPKQLDDDKRNTMPDCVQIVDGSENVLEDFRIDDLRSVSRESSIVTGTISSSDQSVFRVQVYNRIPEKVGYTDHNNWILVNGEYVGGVFYGATDKTSGYSPAFTLHPGINIVEVYSNIRPWMINSYRTGVGLTEHYMFSPVIYVIDYQGTEATIVPQEDVTDTSLADLTFICCDEYGNPSAKSLTVWDENEQAYILAVPSEFDAPIGTDTYYSHSVFIKAKPKAPGATITVNGAEGLVVGSIAANCAYLNMEALYGNSDRSFTLTVTAADGTTTKDYPVKVVYSAGTDSEVTITGVKLDVEFDKDVQAYYLDFENASSSKGSLSVSMPKGATATINGEIYTEGSTFVLDPKQDYYLLKITAEDGYDTAIYYFVTRYADGTIPYATVSDSSKALAKEMLGNWFKSLENGDTDFGGYWSIFMAKATGNADGSEYDFNGAYVYDPARHEMKQATDWAACILEIVMLGRNPYDFPRYVDGEYVEHFDYVEGLLKAGGGAWANNVWYHMGTKAAGAPQTMLSVMKDDALTTTKDLDIRAWTIASLAESIETKDMVHYVESLHDVQDTSGKYISLWTNQGFHGASSGNIYTIGCVLSAIASSADPDKEFAYDGHTPLQTIKDVMFKDGQFVKNDGESIKWCKDIIIGLGDILHGSNVWARYTLTEQKYNDLIEKAKTEGIDTSEMPAFAQTTECGKAYYGLYDKVADALEAKGDYSMRPKVTFGMPYELFIDAVKAMPSAEALTSDDLEDLEALIAQYEALNEYNRSMLKSTSPETITKYQALVAKGLTLKDSDNGEHASELYKKIMALPEAKDVTESNAEQVKTDVDAIRNDTSAKDKALLRWAGASVLEKLEAVANAAGSPQPSITVTFELLGDEKHAVNSDFDLHTYRFGGLETWLGKITVSVPEDSTVGEVFQKVLNENNFAFAGLDNGYIETIKELSAKDNTANSGWMYMVDGKHPEVGLNDYVLSDKDVVTWHWTDDFRLEEGAERMNAERVTEYVENLISASSNSEEARQKARDAYDKLTKDEQKLIKNYQQLKDAEDNAKKAKKVIELINDIGTVTKDSKGKIEKARKAYDALTEDQKKLIPQDVLKTLEDAEAAYAELLKASDAGVKEIKLGNIKAKADKNNTFTLEIPYSENASLPKNSSDFTITLVNSKAGVTTALAPVKEGDYSK